MPADVHQAPADINLALEMLQLPPGVYVANYVEPSNLPLSLSLTLSCLKSRYLPRQNCTTRTNNSYFQANPSVRLHHILDGSEETVHISTRQTKINIFISNLQLSPPGVRFKQWLTTLMALSAALQTASSQTALPPANDISIAMPSIRRHLPKHLTLLVFVDICPPSY
jgi:hypothetical protein